MALFMAATTFGPLIGPVASGFIAVISWRWTFWLGLIIAGVTWIPLLAMPETYAPVILKRRAKRLRKQTGDPNIFAPIELEPRDVRHVVTVVLTRPIRMMLFEWIVLFFSLYLSFVYAVFYMFFQAYPIMYRGGYSILASGQKPPICSPARAGTYGFNAGEEGLAFLPSKLSPSPFVPQHSPCPTSRRRRPHRLRHVPPLRPLPRAGPRAEPPLDALRRSAPPPARLHRRPVSTTHPPTNLVEEARERKKREPHR